LRKHHFQKAMLQRLMITSVVLGLAVTGAHSQTAYRPQPASPPQDAGYILPDGAIQIVGWDDLSGMFEKLNALYAKSHPGTKFLYVPGNLIAPQHSLIFGETAFAPIGMEFSSNLGSAYRALVKAPTYSVRIAHGAVGSTAKLSPLVFIVHPSNPIERLSSGQLLHIFTVGGRAPDIVLWKQAGVKGELGDREIKSYGLPETDHYPSEDPGFGVYLFRDKWGLSHNARNYEMQATYAEVTKKVSEDPAGIGITTRNRVTPDVKVIAVTAGDWGTPMVGSKEDVLSGRYPFDRFLYIYVRRFPGQPIDPFVREYLRMVLSKEGQETIAADAKGYLPLNATELADERVKLD
jgi:phosphate transport system substrate-binding protein